MQIDQGGLGMPVKYFQVIRNDTVLMAYENMIYSTAVQMGAADHQTTRDNVKAIVDLEINMAKVIHIL